MRYPNIFLILAFIFGCSHPIENSGSSTFFNGTRNGEGWVGDGSARSRRDSVLHIRGTSVNGSLSQQIDIRVENTSSGSYPIDFGKAVLRDILGGDVGLKTFRSQGQVSDYITFDLNMEDGYVSGQFKFVGFWRDTSLVAVEGEFNIEVGEYSSR